MREPRGLVAMVTLSSGSNAARIALCAILVAAAVARAEVPPLKDLQGIVTEDGLPVNAIKRMSFRLTDSSGIPQYWTSGPLDLQIATGVFKVDMDIGAASAPWRTMTPYILVSDENRPMSLDQRTYPLDSIAGYALHAAAAETLIGIANPFVRITTSVVINPGSLGIGLAGGTAGPLHVRTQAVDALVVSTNGRAGLGTANPSARLEVFNGNIKLTQPGSGLIFPDGVVRSGTRNVASGISNQGDLFIRADSDGNGTGGILLLTGGTTVMFIANSGSVGINTASPADTLEVGGGAIVRSGVAIRGTGLTGTQTVFQVAGSTFVIRADGQVGIGTSDPQSALQIVGNGWRSTSGDGVCNSPSHAGRMVGFSVCMGASGWVYK